MGKECKVMAEELFNSPTTTKERKEQLILELADVRFKMVSFDRLLLQFRNGEPCTCWQSGKWALQNGARGSCSRFLKRFVFFREKFIVSKRPSYWTVIQSLLINDQQLCKKTSATAMQCDAIVYFCSYNCQKKLRKSNGQFWATSLSPWAIERILFKTRYFQVQESAYHCKIELEVDNPGVSEQIEQRMMNEEGLNLRSNDDFAGFCQTLDLRPSNNRLYDGILEFESIHNGNDSDSETVSIASEATSVASTSRSILSEDLKMSFLPGTFHSFGSFPNLV